MKRMMIGIGFVAAGLMTAHAEFTENVRQALQTAVAEAQKSMAVAPALKGKNISVLPLAKDEGAYAEGLLKNAVTAGGLVYVEGKTDPLWEEIMKEIAWDERKNTMEMLDPATVATFGKLKATQLLLYGAVRDAAETGQRVFVEMELHITSIETKQHLWGGVFARRFYLPGEVIGPIDLTKNTRATLKKAVMMGAESIKSSEKLGGVKNALLAPIAGDIDQYVKGCVRDMLSQTPINPKELDVGTLAEARQLLRDKPAEAEAVICGALRDLSWKRIEALPWRTNYEVNAEVQISIQSAQSSEVLWSGTLGATGSEVFETTQKELGVSLLVKYRWEILMGVGVLVVLILFSRFAAAMRRPR